MKSNDKCVLKIQVIIEKVIVAPKILATSLFMSFRSDGTQRMFRQKLKTAFSFLISEAGGMIQRM